MVDAISLSHNFLDKFNCAHRHHFPESLRGEYAFFQNIELDVVALDFVVGMPPIFKSNLLKKRRSVQSRGQNFELLHLY